MEALYFFEKQNMRDINMIILKLHDLAIVSKMYSKTNDDLTNSVEFYQPVVCEGEEHKERDGIEKYEKVSD